MDLSELQNQFWQDNADQLFLIKEMEDYDDDSVYHFLNKVIADESVEDYVRIEALQLLRFKDISSMGNRKLVATNLISVLSTSKDYDVRNYCAMALISFIDEKGVVKILSDICLDESEDENLRFNALDSLVSNKEFVEVKAQLIRISLLIDSTIGDEAKRNLKD